LVNETILVVVNAHCPDRAFAEVEDFVTVRRTFAGNRWHLVVAVQMVFISPVAELYSLEQLVGDIRVAGRIEEGGKSVQAGEDAVLDGIRRHVTGPA